MKIKRSEAQAGEILYESTHPKNIDAIKNIEEREHTIENDNHSIYITEKWLSGTYISYLKLYHNNSSYLSTEYPNTNIIFLFCLEGTVECKACAKKDTISLIKNEQFIDSGSQNKLLINLVDNTEYICLQLTHQHYQHLTGKQFNNDVSIYDSKQIEPEIKLILNSLINQKNQERIKRISIEAKIYELLVFFINKANHTPVSLLKKHDVDKIWHAKKLVENNLQSPLSLIELSRKAGINDYKLKIGFKELTGYTVFGYVCKIRMEKAYYHLSKERKTVNEVAFMVGYKNAQHFTVAFKKMYNVLPGSLNKDKFLYANV